MMSAKSIPAAGSAEAVERWMWILCAELANRAEEEFSASKRWPKTLAVCYLNGHVVCSRDEVASFGGGE